jgi:hypothetical protein
MAKFQNNNGCIVEINPFMDYSFRFTKLKLHEAIGGPIASGSAVFEFPCDQKCTDLIEDTYYIKIGIQQEKGIVYNIDALITSKMIIDNQLSIEFMCIKDVSFIDETLSLNFTDINEALDYSYQGPRDLRCESDLANNMPIVQFQETSYDFCKRMAQSFKYNSLFAFGLEGFMIKDTVGINSFGVSDSPCTIKVTAGTGSIMQEQLTKSNLNPQYYKKPFDSWNETMEGDEINESNKTEHGQDEYSIQSSVASAIINFNKYSIVHKDIFSLKKNFDFNSRYYNSSYYSNLAICHNDSLPNFKLGDIIEYENLMEKDIKNPFKFYIVYENDILITSDSTSGHENGKGFAWKTLLKGIESGNGEILSQTNNPSKLK